jgi:predicted CoA-binding protein
MTGTPEPGSAREVTTEPTSYGPDAAGLRSILEDARTIAVVGLSSRPERPSFGVSAYMQGHGYHIVPVNPKETEVLGETAYPSLLDVPKDIRIDIVDVFRRAELTPPIARDAVRVGAKVLWLQEGIVNDEARRIGEDAGLTVIMDVCIRVAHRVIDEGGD